MNSPTERESEFVPQGPWSVGEPPYDTKIFGADGFEVADTPNASAIHRDYYAGRLDDGHHWATAPGAHRDVADGEAEANARLIAAAPDLLEALRWCASVIQEDADQYDLTRGHPYVHVLAAARTAIAKATQADSQ